MAAQAQRFLSSRARWFVFLMIVAVAIYLLAVTPVRTYLDQREQMQAAEKRHAVLVAANKDLVDRTVQLQSDEEIARLARERYELVPNGTQAYAVMPPAPTAAPAPQPDDTKKGFWSSAWDNVTFWN